MTRGDQPILVDVDLTFTERSRVAVVGPNGVGKSTLLRVLAGRLRPDRGRIAASPPTLTVGLLAQEPDREARARSGSDAGPTAREVIAGAVGITAAERDLEAASRALAGADDTADVGDRYERALERYLDVGVPDFDQRLLAGAEELGLAGGLLDREHGRLSGGEAERVALLSIVLSRYDLTLLDEPTNNLDTGGLDVLERWIEGHDGGIVVVSHDRAFLERIVTSVVEIDHHHHTVSSFAGGWASFLEERRRAHRQAEQRYADYVVERDRLSARVQQQREWVDRGASRAKKRPADGDIFRKRFAQNQTEKLAAKSKATLKALDRLEVVDKPWEPWQLRFTIADAERSADVVATFDRAVFRRGGFELGPITHEIRWADRLAVVGPNGSGKSSFIAGLTGRLEPVEGSVRRGPGLAVGELDQTRFTSGRDRSTPFPAEGRAGTTGRGSEAEVGVLESFQARSGLPADEARSLMAKFGLGADAVGRTLGSLSPGERTRFQLAEFQARAVNLLILDEPTNHLDLDAIGQLESALASYRGTLVLVSHDRRLLENVEVTDTLDLTDQADGGERGRCDG